MKHLMLVVTLSLGLLAGAQAQPVYQARALNTPNQYPRFEPRQLNNLTQVTGQLLVEYDRWVAAVWDNGTYRFLQKAIAVRGINDLGETSGTTPYKIRRRHQACWWNTKGNIVLLGVPPRGQRLGGSQGSYINNRRWIAGHYDDSDEEYARAAVWMENRVVEIPLINGVRNGPTGINDNGWVVGQETDRHGGMTWGWLWTQDNGVSTLPILPWDVNEQNVICGRGADQGRGVAAIWRDGVVTRIGDGWAYAINNRNEVVGEGIRTDVPNAFLWTGGRYYNLYDLLRPEDQFWIWFFEANPIDINDKGEILVSGRQWDGNWNYFLLAPIEGRPQKEP